MFKDVVGFEEYFQVSELGELYSKRTNKLLKQTKLKNGYLTVASKLGGRKGKNICLRIHICVAKAFIPNPLNFPQVNHIDGNKENNNYKNLEWSNNSQNQLHAYKLGLNKPIVGEKNIKAKLTKTQVLEAKMLYNTNNFSYRDLANMYGVAHTTIMNAIKGLSYF